MDNAPLDVLVIESHTGTASAPVAELLDAGHRIHRCQDSTDDHPFRCRGLQDPSACPLDNHVDVVLVVRSGVHPQPTDLEAGVRCAIRAHVPLVEHGIETLDPYAPWVEAQVLPGEDVVQTCLDAVHASLSPLEAKIRSRVAGLLAAATIEPDKMLCRFRPDGHALDVELVLPVEVSQRVKHALAVRVLDAIRGAGRTFGHVDVHVTTYLHRVP